MKYKLLSDLGKGAYNGYMSSMITKTSLMQKLITKYRDKRFYLYDNNWLPFAIFYEAIFGRRGIFICEPIVKYRHNLRVREYSALNLNKRYVDYLYLDREKIRDYFINIGYPRETINIAFNANLLWVVYISLFIKLSEPNQLLRGRAFVSSSPKFKIVFLLVDKVPIRVSKLIFRIINKVREIKDDGL